MQLLVSLDWATEYFATSRPKADEWKNSNDTERLQYLNRASVLIRYAFVWHSGVDVEDDDRIRIAVCEQALWLMRRTDEYPDALTKGIVSASVGGGAASATFSKDFIAPLICEEAKITIGEAGSFVGKLAQITTRPLGYWESTSGLGKSKEKSSAVAKYVPMTDDEVDHLVDENFQ